MYGKIFQLDCVERNNNPPACAFRQRERRMGRNTVFKIALEIIEDEEKVCLFKCGNMEEKCQYCEARHFKLERTRQGHFSICCSKGKVKLPPLSPYPDLLKALVTNNHPKSTEF